MTTRLLALEKDLFFSVKIRDTLRHHDYDVIVARNLTGFEQQLQADPRPALAIINISIAGVDWETAIRQARAQEIPVLAFGSHVDLEAQKKARAAGAQRVLANSRFSSDMPEVVKRTLQAPDALTNEEPEDVSEEH